MTSMAERATREPSGLGPALRRRLALGRGLAGYLLAGAASLASADGVFLPLASGVAGAPGKAATAHRRALPEDAEVVWERQVRVDIRELARARADVEALGQGRVLLNLDTGLALDAIVDRTAPTFTGYSLSGRIEHPTVGFVTLVASGMDGNSVAGSIWSPNATYEVVPLGGGIHAVREVRRGPVKCDTTGTTVEPQSEMRSRIGARSTADGDDGSIVDILVVWTPDWEEAVGEDAIRAKIDLAIAYTNDALERSGALVSLRLVGAERVDDYTHSDDGYETFVRVINDADGHMDGVHARRDVLGADLVSLVNDQITPLAVGGLADSEGPFSWSRLAAPSTFAHEIGHNFGVFHQRNERNTRGSIVYPLRYRHGYVIRDELLGQCWFTIMVGGLFQDECLRYQPLLPLYASPESWLPAAYPIGGIHIATKASAGDPLGVSRYSARLGFDGPADAVLTINRARYRTANFRRSKTD